MNNASIDAALWRIYKHLGAEIADGIPPDRLAGYLMDLMEGEGDDRAAIGARIAEVRANRARLAELLRMPLVPQRSEQWYELRRQRLTASDAAQALGKGKFGTRATLLNKKIKERAGNPDPFNSNMAPLKWGTMYEDMALRCYSQSRGDIAVHEFGLIPHPTLTCFGASPDGITELGTMVEIKCPYRRKINGQIPEQYWIQMQGQMAVCGITECDYIECEMEELPDKEAYFEKTAGSTTNHGVIAEYTRRGKDGYEYDYSAPGLAGMQAYRNAEQQAAARMRSDPDIQLAKLTMWRLKYMNVIRVAYDHAKWMEMVPQIQDFWDQVLVGAPPAAGEAKRTLVLSPSESPTGSSNSKQCKYAFLESDDDE